MHRATRSFIRLSALATVVACAGCGPFGYLKKTAKDASMAVADAERVDAEKYAPYEYWGSKAYLDQSKVMMGYSEYERSFDYGDRATQLANEAKKKAERREAGVEREVDEDITTPEKMPEGEQPQEPAEQPDPDAQKAGKDEGKAKGEAKDGKPKAGGKAGAKAGGGGK